MPSKIFKRLYIFFIAFSLPFTFSGCKFISSGKSQKTAGGEEKKVEKIAENVELNLSTSRVTPGNFTVVKIGPISFLPEIEIKTGFTSVVSLPLRREKYAYVFLGTSYRAEPGQYDVKVGLEGLKAKISQWETGIEIDSRNFPVSRFSVPETRTEGWTEEKLREARKKVNAARKETVTRPLWTASFIWPVKGDISSEFGALRIINKKRSYHAGIDFAKTGGTPVKSTNSGIVRLKDNLPAQGKIVIIDHGLDISSSYLHLKDLRVVEGQKVKTGEVIGTVGMTGYTTGNHLHWSVHIGLLPANPEQFIRKEFVNPDTFFESNTEIKDFSG